MIYVLIYSYYYKYDKYNVNHLDPAHKDNRIFITKCKGWCIHRLFLKEFYEYTEQDEYKQKYPEAAEVKYDPSEHKEEDIDIFNDIRNDHHRTKLGRIREWANKVHPFYEEKDLLKETPLPSEIIKAMWMAKCIMCKGPSGYLYDILNQQSLELKPGKSRSHLCVKHTKHYDFIKYVFIKSFIRSI